MSKVTTLGQFIIERQADFPYAKGELSRLLRDIGIASKIVNREVSKAGLVNILGETGDTNVQGEKVKKLDIYANDQFISALKSGGECCMIASEENEGLIYIDSEISSEAKYIVAIDPLDGSSNIDVNVSVRSEEHTSELQSLMRISYAVFCLKKKNTERYKQAHIR